MGFGCDCKLIFVVFILPTCVFTQNFQPLSYRVVNGQIYMDPPTTASPTFMESYFPFLSSSYESSNPESIDEAILNSVTGPPGAAAADPGTPDTATLLSSFNQYQQPGGQLGQSGAQYQPQQQPGLSPYEQSGMPPQYQQPGMPPYPQGGLSQYPQPGLAQNQMSSPYLTNEDDIYLSSGSVSSPQQVLPDGSLGPNMVGPPPPNMAGYPPQPPPPTNYAPNIASNYPPPPGNYPPSHQPQTPSFYETNHYSALQPNPYGNAPKLPYPLSDINLEGTTEKPAPFYQPILNFFGWGSSSEATPTVPTFTAGGSSFPSNIFSSGSFSAPLPFSQSTFPFSASQFAQARKSNAEETKYEDESSDNDVTFDDSMKYETQSAPAETSFNSKQDSTAEKDKEEKFPCPKLGLWQWDGEYCIAIGPVPTWACKPNDLAMTGRLAVCRNKFFLPTGTNYPTK